MSSCSFQVSTLIPLCPSGYTSERVSRPISGHPPLLCFLPLISLDELVAGSQRTFFLEYNSFGEQEGMNHGLGLS